MTEAILAWQALIFASIMLAGRWRGWIIAFWIVWTLLQVAALPLSVLQFGTIAVGAWVFRAKSPAGHSSSEEAEATATRPGITPRSSPEPQNAPALTRLASYAAEIAGQAEAWSVESQRRLDELRREQQFRKAAEQKIKTEGFSCALEERVMRQALARDQQLAEELKQALGKDGVLRKLYDANLKRLEYEPQSVLERQEAEKEALKIAKTERELLDRLIDTGPEFKRHYFEAERLLSDLDAASIGAEAHLQLHGRHLNDWLADVKALRGSRNSPRHSAASSVAALFGAYPAQEKTTPKAPQLLEGSITDQPGESPRTATAYVTRNTFKRVGRHLQPISVSIDAIYRHIYRTDLASILNRGEATRLYVLRRMLEGHIEDLKASERSFSRDYVFSVGQSKYHASPECEYLKASFSNYRVPPEIEEQGADKVREFQQFCEANKHLLKDKSPATFWAHVGAQFRISSHPRPVLYANSGVQELALGVDATQLQEKIEMVITEVEDIIGRETNSGAVVRLRYAPNPKRALETLGDPAIRAHVEKFFDLKRQLIDLLFEFYKRESGQDELALPVMLLESAGLAPCRGCCRQTSIAGPSLTIPEVERGKAVPPTT